MISSISHWTSIGLGAAIRRRQRLAATLTSVPRSFAAAQLGAGGLDPLGKDGEVSRGHGPRGEARGLHRKRGGVAAAAVEHQQHGVRTGAGRREGVVRAPAAAVGQVRRVRPPRRLRVTPTEAGVGGKARQHQQHLHLQN